MRIFSGSSNIPLATRIAKKLNTPLSDIQLSKFPNGETRVWVQEDVRRENAVLIQSFSEPVDFHIVEFALMADALKRCGARKIVGVIPWLGYSLQDKAFRPGEPIAAKVIADFISKDVKRHILVNLHSDSITGFFPVPATQVSALETFVAYAKKQGIKNAVVVSPDFGGIKRARVFANKLDLPLVNINKERNRVTGKVTVRGISEPVTDKTCLVIDDIISTGSTLLETARILRHNGAKTIRFFATHALFSEGSHKKFASSEIDELVVTDTVLVPEEKQFKKLKIVSIDTVLLPEIEIWT